MPDRWIKKILIANRGEIALRIQQSCRRLKVPCSITVSEADRGSFFAGEADEPAFIDGFTAKDSYLNISKIIKAARRCKCNAIHPGYGFLSENAVFAKAVEKAGLIFIGPSYRSIEALGDKAKARRIAELAKVPVTPGTAPGLTDKKLALAAKKIGYPVLIKAVAGGGGRGMRIVYNADELTENLTLARAEAKKNFLDSRVYLEKYIEEPRHVEVQVVSDNYGNYLHLGTRDCSTQRRHQKLIEEAPAPFIPDALRSKIEGAALRVARQAGYNSIGTAEFLLSGNKFYFLEMNTRIQVEHPVSEEVTGLDLVRLQIETAENKPLKLKQSEIKFKKHSIEFRINAEDPGRNFVPVTGKIEELRFPKAKDVRIERGFQSGDEISPYYDGLIAKVIVTGKNREEALKRSERYLKEVSIKGIKTTLPFHIWALGQDQFRRSTFDIALISREFNPRELFIEEASKLSDPRHKGPGFSEELSYHSEKFGVTYQIRILHLPDGSFLCMPLKKNLAAREIYCRRSNSFSQALEGLKSEVLEKESPGRIFKGAFKFQGLSG